MPLQVRTSGLTVRHALAGMIIAGAVLYSFAFQGLRGLWETSEGRYADVALEMLRLDDWLHPKLHHEHPHWTKPPMTYWAIAASVKAFGRTETAARLPGALAFALSTLLVFVLGRLFCPQNAWLPALIYATFLFPASASNMVTTDNLLTLGETAAVTGFAYAYWGAAGSFGARYGALLGWAASGIGYLIKGPAVALPLLALAVFHGARGRKVPGLRLHWVTGPVLAAAIGSSWYLLLSADHPGLFLDFLWNEVILRAVTGREHRHPEWYGALVVYGPVLVLGTLPWTLTVWGSLKDGVRDIWRSRRGQGRPVGDHDLFLMLWVLIPLTVFVLARSRLPLYVLPIFVPLALLAARVAARTLLKRPGWWRLPVAGAALVLIVRITAGLLSVPQDDRALAAQLRDLAPSDLQEVVFVDTDAQLGLSFYLDTEVEAISTKHTAKTGEAEGALAEELAETEGARLWLVRSTEAERFAGLVASMDRRPQRLGGVKGEKAYTVFRVW